MKCPYCEFLDSKVIDSRPTDEGQAIRRRRECIDCGKRFTTYEKIEEIPIMVVKKDGNRQSYNRNKLLNGIIKSCEKRPVSMNTIEKIIYTCCNIKRLIVEEDEEDRCERMILNFGHTLGHAIEKYYNFTGYSHGEAISIGMYYITLISEQNGISKIGTAQEIKEILINFGLPFEVELKDNDAVIDTIALDKKNLGNVLKVILIKDIGESIIYDTKPEFFKEVK